MALRPAKNVRYLYNKRCCARCRYWRQVHSRRDEGYACDRVHGLEGDWNASEPEFHVCDGFQWGAATADFKATEDEPS